MEDGEAELEKLGYELSRKALERQERTLDELRSRTALLLAASSVSASFLGARAAESRFGVLTAALFAFVVSIGLAAYVVFPQPGLIFSIRGSTLIDSEADDPAGIRETYRRLAYWLEGFLDDNQPLIDKRFAAYRLATIALLGQVVLWVVEILTQ